MNIIKTELLTTATDPHGNLDLNGGLLNLGLVLGSRNVYDKQFPTDETGLQKLKAQLESTAFKCFSGLDDIGAIITAANPVDLDQSDLANLGMAITHLAKLGKEVQDHIEDIEIDLSRRNGYLTNPEQAALHAELHRQAMAAEEDGLDYLQGVELAAGIMVNKAGNAAKGSA